MGLKEELLRNILGGIKGESISLGENSIKNINEVKRVYKLLLGTSNKLPLRIGNFDIKVQGTYIELDEHLHFNRYRLITLNSSIYKNTKIFNLELYKKLCKEHEEDCLKSGGYGGKWKNNSTEKLFAKSSPYKDLRGNGPSRWRQRAFYDFMKDLYATEKKIKLRRFSVWERIESGVLIKDILDKKLKAHYPQLRTHVMSK
ncbi:MAG: hypothetical protein ACMXYL_01290, partial [Candidatus Woesearchaeota archaeon]